MKKRGLLSRAALSIRDGVIVFFIFVMIFSMGGSGGAVLGAIAGGMAGVGLCYYNFFNLYEYE